MDLQSNICQFNTSKAYIKLLPPNFQAHRPGNISQAKHTHQAIALELSS
jgi:hypothetical protein